MKNALEQIRPSSRQPFDFIENLSEDEVNDVGNHGTFDNWKDIIIAPIANKRSGNPDMSASLRTFNIDMWSLLSAKAEGEAEETWKAAIKEKDSGRTCASTCGLLAPQTKGEA